MAAKCINVLTSTAEELQDLLMRDVLTSVELVDAYLTQITKHNHDGLKLNAVISIADRDTILKYAKELDVERRQGHLRGPFYGIPILIKDLCATVDLPTTCGSFAFANGRAKRNAHVVDTLINAGLIIIGKANLSEFGNAKGYDIMAGWSAYGGQTQSPYIEDGVPEHAPWLSSWGPAGSSSGSAVGVAAGFAPLSIGTESDGSIIMPAARTALYALKLTPGTVDTTGCQPGASEFDCLGAFAKSPYDVAVLSAIMQCRDPDTYLPLEKSWVGLRPGFVDSSLWRSYPSAIEPVDGFFEQTDAAMFEAQERIAALGGKVVKSIPLASWDDIVAAMPDFRNMEDLFPYQMKRLWPDFLAQFEGVPQSLDELIEFNKTHADVEFTQRNNNQLALEAGRDSKVTQDKYDRNLKALREKASGNIRRLLNEYDVDVILGPCDSRLGSVGAAPGFPVGNLPLGFANFNGRPFSLHMIAPANEEGKMLRVMSAWATMFPENVRPSPLLVEG